MIQNLAMAVLAIDLFCSIICVHTYVLFCNYQALANLSWNFFNSLCISLQNSYKYLVLVSFYRKYNLSGCHCVVQNF